MKITSRRRSRPTISTNGAESPPSILDTAPPEDFATVLRASLTALHAAEDAVRRVRALHARGHRLALSPLDTTDGTRPDPVEQDRDVCTHCLLRWPCPTVAALNDA